MFKQVYFISGRKTLFSSAYSLQSAHLRLAPGNIKLFLLVGKYNIFTCSMTHLNKIVFFICLFKIFQYPYKYFVHLQSIFTLLISVSRYSSSSFAGLGVKVFRFKSARLQTIKQNQNSAQTSSREYFGIQLVNIGRVDDGWHC